MEKVHAEVAKQQSWSRAPRRAQHQSGPDAPTGLSGRAENPAQSGTPWMLSPGSER